MQGYIAWIIAGALLFLYISAFVLPSFFRTVLRFIFKSGVGIMSILAYNWIMGSTLISVNVISFAICGVLGLPGAIALILSRIIYL